MEGGGEATGRSGPHGPAVLVEPERHRPSVRGDDEIGASHVPDPTGALYRRDRSAAGTMASMPAERMPQPRLLAAPDKLKGTLAAAEAAEAMAEGARAAGWEADRCPLSDGGEGFAEVLARLGGEERTTTVTGPLGASVVARWRLAGDEAVVESAAASGLVLAGGSEGNDPLGATSRGTGELVVAAIRAGARRVLVGVGGSAMTDGGLGAVEAVEEAGGLGGADVVVACDVRAGFLDAAALFGPQKGAGPAEVEELARRLAAVAARYRDRTGVDVTALPGAGAAGGLAGGLASLGARLVPGFDLVADVVGLRDRLADADLVVTAEGLLDASSWTGKVVSGVAGLAEADGVPVLVVAGAVGEGGTPAPERDIEVCDLTPRFGAPRARGDPARCIVETLSELLPRRRPR